MSTLEGERDPLLCTTTTMQSDGITQYETTSPSQANWTAFHTIWSIGLRIVGDLLIKNIFIFYENYRSSLGLNAIQFSTILIAQQFGSVIAMICLPWITLYFPSLYQKITICGCLCGIFAALFEVTPLLTNNIYLIIVFGCIDRLCFSVNYFVYTTSVLDLASKTNDENSGKQGKVIAFLNLSWTLASLLYFVLGYSIEYVAWWFNFVLFGVMLCAMSIASQFVYAPFRHYNGRTLPSLPWFTMMRSVLANLRSVVIFTVSLIMGCFKTSIAIILSSVWLEDVFHLNSFQVGLVLLTVFGGELSAALTVSRVVDKYGVFKCSAIPFALMSGVCFAFLMLVYFLGPTVGGIVVAVLIIYAVYFGWESFFILHQLFCIQNSPSKNHTSLMLMMNYVCIMMGGMVGSYTFPIIWHEGNGMAVINVIWLSLIMICIILYGVLYYMRSRLAS